LVSSSKRIIQIRIMAVEDKNWSFTLVSACD
jgi:hypothetical protein